nr:MAG TPA: hypothetical protein [Caudoviricetes sp.]
MTLGSPCDMQIPGVSAAISFFYIKNNQSLTNN